VKNTIVPRGSGLYIFLSIVVVVAVLRLAREVLVPLALAILLSFLFFPLVLRLQRFLGRILAVILVTGTSFVLTAILAWVAVGHIANLVDKLPEYEENIRAKIQTARLAITDRFERASRSVDEIAQELAPVVPVPLAPAAAAVIPAAPAPDVPPASPIATIRALIAPLLAPLGTVSIVIVFVIFLLIYHEDLSDRLLTLAGVDQLGETTRTMEDAGTRVSRYLLRHSMINAIHGVLVGLGAFWIGLPAAIFWGLSAALLRFIPYLGPLLSAVLPLVLSLAIFDGWAKTLELAVFFTLLEIVSNNLLEPWLYAGGTGLSPVAVIVAAVFWTWLWGPAGLALSAPLTVCVVVLGKHVPPLRFLDTLLNDQRVLDASAELYQRLLAMNLEGAASVVERESKDHSLPEVFDEVILPALALAEHDRHRGDLEGDRAEFVDESLLEIIEDCGEASVDQDAAKPDLSFPAGLERLSVVCLPARDRADELAAIMLVQLLKKQGLRARTASATSFTGEVLEALAKEEVSVLCISAVPPAAVPHVRSRYRRLRTRFEQMPIVIGMWTTGTDPERLRERFPNDEAVDCVTNLAGACRVIMDHARAVGAANAKQRTMA